MSYSSPHANITNHLNSCETSQKLSTAARAPSLAQAETTGRSICVWCHSRRSLRVKPHISDNHVQCVGLRGPSDTENRASPLFSTDTGALTPLLSAHWLSTLALFEPRTQTQDRRVGRVKCLWLLDSHTHTHTYAHTCSCTHKPQSFNVHTQAGEQF